jgi:hypothetical protein
VSSPNFSIGDPGAGKNKCHRFTVLYIEEYKINDTLNHTNNRAGVSGPASDLKKQQNGIL